MAIDRLTLRAVPYGVWPLFAIMGCFVSGVTYASVHALRHNPEAVFLNRKNNPHPWLNIQSHQTPKIYDHSGHFEEKWKHSMDTPKH
jgi:hypothetical protein